MADVSCFKNLAEHTSIDLTPDSVWLVAIVHKLDGSGYIRSRFTPFKLLLCLTKH